MWTRLHVTVLLGITVVSWGLLLFVRGVPLSWDQLWPFSSVVALLVVLGVALEHWLWRQALLFPWLVNRPDLRGTWACELSSSWPDPLTGLPRLPFRCYMGVTQTLGTLQLHLMTPESESWLLAHAVHASPKGGCFEVVGVYTNQPSTHLRGSRSEIHYGAILLTTHGPARFPDAIDGEYWTDRGTKGTMRLSRGTPHLFTRFADAEAQLGNGSRRRQAGG